MLVRIQDFLSQIRDMGYCHANIISCIRTHFILGAMGEGLEAIAGIHYNLNLLNISLYVKSLVSDI